MKAKTEATLHEFQTQLKEIAARAKGGRTGVGEGEGAVKLLKFNGITTWAVFWHQFDRGHRAYVTVARPNIVARWPKRQPSQCYTLELVSAKALPILKEVLLTVTWDGAH
jgi:hypothetical protein